MGRKGFLFVIIFLFSYLLAACNIETVSEHEKLEVDEQSIQNEQEEKSNKIERQKNLEIAQGEKELTKENLIENTVVETTAPVEQNKETKTEEKSKTTSTTQKLKEQNPSKSESKHPEKTVGTKEDSKTATQTEKPNTNQPSTQPKPKPNEEIESSPKRYVTIGIYVKTLLNNWELLEAPLQSEKYVPSNGVILKASKYELLSEKETVWDVLLRATKEHSIQLEYQGANENIYNSVYVEGINHLYEFSAGELSGWMYSVNGVFPNFGCSQYVLKDGDVIEWHYTVDLGRDLGHDWNGSK
ncbi:DUF4430 domain-containing protein [Lysinibacillus sp. SGAir0095]|uniref:DUF4430 domain-containing protein n=1 Tax=Lysinibacillus sp. SGAir0095 TaxID=2070463 RepID=UPI0010CD240A|nr:DUF4430 domain-containing protein [Lysinibacillus sp. SGAir0095]QCR32100.1 hypothetical protein C1N55_07905 [Lysinibacillus sp. SGAir0095]